MLRTLLPALIASLACSSVARAQFDGDDIILRITDNAITTHATPTDTGERVFIRTLGDISPNYTDVGFDNLPGTFDPASRLGFRILGSLKRWTGAGLAPTPDVTLQISNFATFFASTPADESTVTGYTLPVGSNGEWHRHLDFDLLPITPTDPPADPAPGVYVVQLQLFSSTGSPTDSQSFYIALDQSAAPGEPDAAAAWLRDSLTTPPCLADFDGSGGTPDSTDIEAFFTAWLAGDPSADADNSGGTPDTTDIDEFFQHWLAGC